MKYLLLFLVTMSIIGCTIPVRWDDYGGSRPDGVVRVGYEYRDFFEPGLVFPEDQPQQLVKQKCLDFGYTNNIYVENSMKKECLYHGGAEGKDKSCESWRVTQEYKCTNNN